LWESVILIIICLSIDEINIIYVHTIESTFFFFLHGRLGYLIFKYLKYMCKHDYISYQQDNNNKCQVCIQAKMTKKTFFKLKNSELLELVHYNICEINGMLTSGGKRYFIIFIGDCSRFTYFYLLRTKNKVFKKFKKIIKNANS